MNRIFLSVVMCAVSASMCFAEDVRKSSIEDQKTVEVTIYNSDLALVKDLRSIGLNKGEGELRFMDVASQIMPETVSVKSLNFPDQLSILEQNYEYDLLNANKLLDKYVGKTIKLVRENFNETTGKTVKDIVEAKLLSNNGSPIYEIDGEIHAGFAGQPIFPQIPENLIAEPTLTWLYANASGKAHDVELSYLTRGMSWKADYVAVLNKTDDGLNLNGWVTLNNNSGTMYKNAKLKLIAGDVNRVQPELNYGRGMMMKMAAMEMDVAAPQFAEQAFFEYHIYDLQRPTTIKSNQSKQISLLEANAVKAKKEFVVRGDQNYYWGDYRGSGDIKHDVEVVVRVENKKDNNMGMPLPAGILRMYKEDANGSLQFVGEDRIDHTPKDEEVELKIGKAFDVTAKRRQTSFEYKAGNDTESSWEITLKNHKEEDIVVTVIEPLHGDWRILAKSHEFKKTDAFHVRFDVPVKKDEEVKLTYTVRFDNP